MRQARAKTPPTRRSRPYRIRTTRQIEALASPARQELVDALRVIGPCSIAELAEDLGRAADSLYYHVSKLQQVGLVVPRGTRGDGVRETALYDLPGSELVIDHEPSTARQKASLIKLVSACLRIAERDLRRAIETGLAIYRRSPRRNAWGARVKGWLDPEELARVHEHLEAISSIVAQGKKRPDSGLHAVTFVLTPIAPSDRQRTP